MNIEIIENAFDALETVFEQLYIFITRNQVIDLIVWIDIVAVGIFIFLLILDLFKRRKDTGGVDE